MKKIGVLLCLVALTTGAFAQMLSKSPKNDSFVVKLLGAQEALSSVLKEEKVDLLGFARALANYRKMAAAHTPDQTGMILPAIAEVSDVYLANRDALKIVANKINAPVTFKNGTQMSMTRYIDEFASEMDGLDAFKTALEEDLKVTVKSAGQVKFEEEIAGFNGNANFIGQYVLINLADPMRDMTDEEATPLAKEYVKYQVKDVSLVEFCKNPGVDWHQSALDELAAFGKRVEKLAK